MGTTVWHTHDAFPSLLIASAFLGTLLAMVTHTDRHWLAVSATGEAVAIDMPLTVEAVVAYLGIVLAGCVVVGIADSFAATEIATRLRIAEAKAIITQVTDRTG